MLSYFNRNLFADWVVFSKNSFRLSFFGGLKVNKIPHFFFLIAISTEILSVF